MDWNVGHSRSRWILVWLLSLLVGSLIFADVVAPGWHYSYGKGLSNILQCTYSKNATHRYSDPVSWPQPSQDALDELILKHKCPLTTDNNVTHVFLIPKFMLAERRWLINVVATIGSSYRHSLEYMYDAQLVSVDDGCNGTGSWNTKTIATVDNKYYSAANNRLFELVSFQHDHYLLSMRINADGNPNIKIHMRYQYEGFTKALQWSKAIYFVIVVISVSWFQRQLCSLSRQVALLECLLLILGISTAIRNVPGAFLQFIMDCPDIHILEGLHEDGFYLVLLTFVIVATKENFIPDSTASLKRHRISVTVVAVGCLLHLVFNACARYLLLVNPFMSVWVWMGGIDELKVYRTFATGVMLFMYVTYLVYLLFGSIKHVTNPAIRTCCRLLWVTLLILATFATGGMLLCVYFPYVYYLIRNNRLKDKISDTEASGSTNGAGNSCILVISFLCVLMTVAKWICEEAIEYTSDDPLINLSNPYITLFYISEHNVWNTYVVYLLYLYGKSIETCCSELSSTVYHISAYI